MSGFTPLLEQHASRVAESVEIMSRFVGWSVDQVDVSPDGLLVVRYRAVDGRLGWVVYGGAFNTSVVATELRAGHRVLTRIENAKWKVEQLARTARIAARRDARVMPAESADDCDPRGIMRPVGGVR